MRQCGGGFGLTVEAFADVRVAEQVRRQEFQCDQALELRILGLVDYAHAALAELFEDPVVAD